MYVCICICIYIFIYIYIHMCVCVHMYMPHTFFLALMKSADLSSSSQNRQPNRVSVKPITAWPNLGRFFGGELMRVMQGTWIGGGFFWSLWKKWEQHSTTAGHRMRRRIPLRRLDISWSTPLLNHNEQALTEAKIDQTWYSSTVT